MTDAFTPNLNLDLPVVGASADAWGTSLNNNATTLDLLLAGMITGLQLSAAGSTGTFGIAAGAASGMALASAYTKGAGAWAVGSGNGSLDTGSIANNTWYHVWLIGRTDTSVFDILVSLSATSPTMPTNYTLKRRIGSMKTDSSANWVGFSQIGDKFLWAQGGSEINGVTVTSTQNQQTVNVPTGVIVEALLRGEVVLGTNTGILISSPSESALVNTSNAQFTAITALANTCEVITNVLTNTSAQVNSVVNTGSASLYMGAYGWIDQRGKN